MASTLQLQNSINYAQAFTKLRPLAGVGSVPGEPALSIANTIKGFMLAAPFAWRWNRATKTVSTINGQQDYVVSVPDFGWIEKATVTTSTNTVEIEVKELLADSTQQGRPTHIAAQGDDGSGNITFRLFNVPDAAYTLTVIYQRKATPFQNIDDVWSPIPDELAYAFDTGFLAKAYEQADDPRSMGAWQLFVRQVIAANEGNKDTNKNLFLESHIADERQRQSALLGSQQGRQSRGL